MDDMKALENYKRRVKAQNERIKESYDRISVTLPKGTKERIQAQGLTINGFVNELVLAELERLEAPTAPTNNGDSSEKCPF
jgi:hypothetical protein